MCNIYLLLTLLVIYSSSMSLSSMLKCLSNAFMYASSDPLTLQKDVKIQDTSKIKTHERSEPFSHYVAV